MTTGNKKELRLKQTAFPAGRREELLSTLKVRLRKT